MELKEIIKEYKKKTGFNDAEIARRLNVSRSTVIRWSNGDSKTLNSTTMERLNNLLGYNIEPLLKGMDMYTLPILGYVKGGYDLFSEENYLGEEDVTLEDKKSGDYYLKVTGNSMIGDGIMDGSLILVQNTSSIQNGQIAVVLIGDEVSVKRVIKKGDMLILEASNKDVENRYFTKEEVASLPVKVIGKVISCKTYFN